MRVLLVVCAWLLLSTSAAAHQMSTAYFTGKLTTTGVLEGQWQMRLFDLEQAVGLDGDNDGRLLWLEVVNRQRAIEDYVRQQLAFSRGGQSCSFTLPSGWQVDTHFNESYLVLPVVVQCPLAGALAMDYHAFFQQDSEHKLLVSLTTGDHSHNRVLSDAQRSLTLNGNAGSRWLTFQQFFYQGMIHIWKGLDHVLFLMILLLTCVVTHKAGQWTARDNPRQIIVSAAWLVSAFTLAHSITLSATALGWLNVSSRWVEVGIAATVVLTALNNIYPLVLRLGWLTFGFGLLHGMGFAGVLGELGLPADQKVLTVLAFNVGVEIGQLIIVVLALPLLMAVRNQRWYYRYGLTVSSMAVASLASLWVIQRL